MKTDHKEKIMKAKPEILAIIPARGNSKSIPHKNIMSFAGHPLIAYSIAAAKQAKLVTRVITSTDDGRIAEVAREYHCEVPFMRPVEYAQDDTLDLPVFQHALKWLAEHEEYHPDVVLQLRPTSPIRSVDMVDQAVITLLDHPEADSVRGVVPSAQNPFKMWKINPSGKMEPLLQVESIKEPYNAPRQNLPETYWQTGHIDAIRPATILEKNSMSGETILPLFIDPIYTVDIDTKLDWQRAEKLVFEGLINMVFPASHPRQLPDNIRLLVMDFDGVLTDDRVWVDENGKEMVAANRSDGLGLERLRKLTSIQTLVISKETNPVVSARCQKLGISVLQGIEQKAQALDEFMQKNSIEKDEVVYIGNDINDLECFHHVGLSAVPSDAAPIVKQHADVILKRAGGFGVVRELCEMLIEKYQHD